MWTDSLGAVQHALMASGETTFTPRTGDLGGRGNLLPAVVADSTGNARVTWCRESRGTRSLISTRISGSTAAPEETVDSAIA